MLIPLPINEVGTVSVRKNVAEGEELANLLYILMQPTRQKIVKLLRSSEPLYIEQIAEKINEDRRSVSFHLATLAENGIVEGEYRLIENATKNPGRGRGGKFYKLTPRAVEVIEKLNTVLR
jgi:predicted ArsR family transcriptional regulator